MRKPLTLRTWATPLTMGAFVLMAITGLLLFFEWNTGLTTVAHQWFSWFFLAGAAAHVAVHYRPLKNHLNSVWGRGSLALFSAVLLASLFSWGQITGPQLEWPIMEALVETRLSVLAEMTKREPETLVRELKRKGIVTAPDDRLADAAIANHIGVNRLLGLIFLRD